MLAKKGERDHDEEEKPAPSLPQARRDLSVVLLQQLQIAHAAARLSFHTPRDARCKRKGCAKDAASDLLSQTLEEPGDVWSIQPALHEPSSSLPKPAGAGAYRLVPHSP